MNRIVLKSFAATIALVCLAGLPTNTSQAAMSKKSDVRLAFGGDVHFDGPLKSRLTPHGLKSMRSMFAQDDLAMVNLETSIGTHGSPEDKRYTFRTSSMAFRTLAGAGIDAVTMANNHAIDYGQAGLKDTLASAANSPIPVLGIGRNFTSALAPLKRTIKGQKLAIFAFVGLDLEASTAYTWPASRNRPGIPVWANHKALIMDAIKKAKQAGRTVIVYVHWGNELDECPSGQQFDVANNLVKAGASVIIGSHPHVLQGVGRLHGALVAYSLGNFAWYSRAGVPTGVMRVTLRAGRVLNYQLDPAVYGTDGVPHLVSGQLERSTNNLVKVRTACARLSK